MRAAVRKTGFRPAHSRASRHNPAPLGDNLAAMKHLALEHWLRAAIDLGAFLTGWAIGWLVTDSIAFGLVLALIFVGSAEGGQHVAGGRKRD